MWFGGSGLYTLLALALIMLTGGMIIPVFVIGFFGWFIVSMFNDFINKK